MKKISLVILFAALSAVASASTLYPPIASWSLAGLASKTQRLIASGTLPAAGDAAEGELFLDTTTSPHIIYRKTGAAWVQAGGSGSAGSGVTGTYRFPGLGDDGAEMAISYHNGLVIALTGINPDRTPRYSMLVEYLPGNVTADGDTDWADTSRVVAADECYLYDWGDQGTVNASGELVLLNATTTNILLEFQTSSYPLEKQGTIACRVQIPVATAGKFLFFSSDGENHFNVKPLDASGTIEYTLFDYTHSCIASWPTDYVTAVWTWDTTKARFSFYLDGVQQPLARTATGAYSIILDDLYINGDWEGDDGNNMTLCWFRAWNYEMPARTVAMLTPEPVRGGLVFEALSHNTNSSIGYPVWEDSSLVSTPSTLLASGDDLPEANASDSLYFPAGSGGLVATLASPLALGELTIAIRAKCPADENVAILSVVQGASAPRDIFSTTSAGSFYFTVFPNLFMLSDVNDGLMHTYVVAYSSAAASITLHVDGVDMAINNYGANLPAPPSIGNQIILAPGMLR